MRIINCEKYDNLDLSEYTSFGKVYFNDKYEIDIILKACKKNVDILKEWFNIIQIKYDTLEIVGGRLIVYTINGVELGLQDLSAGEQTLLYMLAYKTLGDKLLVHGILERLGERLTKVLVEQFKEYDLTILMVGSALRECTLPYFER